MSRNWLTRLLPGSRSTENEVIPAMRKYKEVRVESWGELREIFESGEYRSWAFRGQPDASWRLETPLSRYLRRSGVQEKYWKQQEERILRIFRRKAHLHLRTVPDERDSFEWLALMQHHGAPTRLLDFTWSKYVAAFYAFSDPPRGCDAAIWALYPPALASSEKFGPWIYDNFEKYFLPNTKPIVVIGEPHHMNQRLIAHSGTFVVPGQLAIPVEDIVATHISSEPLVKLTLATDRVRRDAIKALYHMNITHATLFPDLDGLARSMGFELELHWQFDPVSGEEYMRS